VYIRNVTSKPSASLGHVEKAVNTAHGSSDENLGELRNILESEYIKLKRIRVSDSEFNLQIASDKLKLEL